MDGPFLISFVWTIPRSKNVSVLFSDSEMTDCTSKIRIFLFVGPFPIHIWVLNVSVDCNYGAYHDVDCPMSTKLAEKSYRIFDYRPIKLNLNS